MQKNTQKIEISVIIPSYNPNPDDLIECLEAINSSSLKPLEIILVDDGSKTDYPERIESLCVLIKNKDNRGPAYAKNYGAKEAKGNILCFIDSDVKIKQNTLAQIAEKLCDMNIAAVQTIFSIYTPVQDFISQYQNIYRHYCFKNIKHEYISIVASYAVAIRKNVFFELGGFPAAIRNASIEDELLGVTLYSKGYNILLAKDISVEHMACLNFKMLLKKTYIMARDGIEYACKYQKLKKMNFQKSHHHPSLIISMIISPLILFLLMACCALNVAGALALAGIVAFFLIVNLNFFIFVNKTKGISFALKSIFTYYFFCLAAFLGCVKGSINYLQKR